MELDQSLVVFGFKMAKVINPMEAIVLTPSDQPQFLRKEPDGHAMSARPYDNHVYIIKAKPGTRDNVISSLWTYHFSGCEPFPDENVLKMSFRTTPEKYALAGDATKHYSEEALLDLHEDIQTVIYCGAFKIGTRWEYRDGDLYPESNRTKGGV